LVRAGRSHAPDVATTLKIARERAYPPSVRDGSDSRQISLMKARVCADRGCDVSNTSEVGFRLVGGR